MGKADKSEKQFMACRDVFAETVNVLLYGGKGILREESLQPAPTESIYIGRDGEQHSQFRDFGMYDIMTDAGVVRAVYLEENQGRVDRKMPLREAGYQGASYRSQYRQGKSQGVYPVISMVLNWGRKPWNGARSIRELVEYPVPEEAEDYLDKNTIHVFDMRHLDNIPFMKKEGGRKMCDLLDEMVEKGMRKGVKAGRREGRREGIVQGIKALIMTCRELGVSFEETANKVRNRFQLTEKETRKHMELYW